MKVTVPRCPAGPAQLTTALCTMGKSLAPLIQLLATSTDVIASGGEPAAAAALASVSANASYMQYPREASMMSRSTCLDAPCVMGYSIVTRIGNPQVEYRFTEWVAFNTKSVRAPDFDSSKGAELYDHTDDVGENTNLCGPAATCDAPARLAGTVAQLRALLRQGPPTGGGWGPWSGSTPVGQLVQGE
jgi:hypothetical protein